jgi:hypothetical protein
MAGPIVLSSTEGASNTDILQGTRLQTVPQGGYLTFELQCDTNTPTANFTVSVQMPNGDTPLNEVRVSSGQGAGILNNNDKMQITLPVAQGGHTVFSATETGTAVLAWRVTYTPA